MMKNTTHRILFESACKLSSIADNSAELVVTSPPYPMIEMWDESFSSQSTEIKRALEASDPDLTFELMHQVLDKIWAECSRVLCEGGIACINIGDATRTIGDEFRLYPNHARIINSFLNLGFVNLPNILWRKQTNAPNKFMGSGMLPAGAYVTLEHEYILVFRKGGKRKFNEQKKVSRRESAFFWEERNKWFSDLWDFKGTTQIMSTNGSRDRSGAFPFELAYRLINMYSINGDTVVDPFLGTGTTTLAAIAAGRNSVGFELEKNLSSIIEKTILSDANFKMINNRIRKRLLDHQAFVSDRLTSKGLDSVKHHNSWFNFPVMTSQEKALRIHFIESIKKTETAFEATYLQKQVCDFQGKHSLFAEA